VLARVASFLWADLNNLRLAIGSMGTLSLVLGRIGSYSVVFNFEEALASSAISLANYNVAMTCMGE
jgi:hypothetical protein